ncbi:MAG: DUF2889 domain-containing protein [Acidimicrobiales bacterium]
MTDLTGPDRSPRLAELRPAAGGEDTPVHRRVIQVEVFERDGYHVVIGTLLDQRPWASGALGPRDLHGMELGIVVRRSDLVIVDARATMGTFPHAECPTIEDSFAELVGLSVSRGYTSAVQSRFGRERGCSHLEFLARALGPVVIQAITSSGAYRVEHGDGEHTLGGGGMEWLTNTCHVWAEGGAGMQKVASGWRPGDTEYPAPTVVEIRRRQAGVAEPPPVNPR